MTAANAGISAMLVGAKFLRYLLRAENTDFRPQ